MSSDIIMMGDMESATAAHHAKLIGDCLETAYPGWMWFVEVKGGIATIKSMHADAKFGFVLHLLTGFYSASDLKRQALRAGGELLERLGMPRRRADWDRMNDCRQDARGLMVYAT
jgi:hypothetical protein